MNIKKPFLHKLAKTVILEYGDIFDNLINQQDFIVKVILEEEKTFNQLKDYLIHYLHRSDYYFVRLEDVNFKKNVELLSKSVLLIASEGMWTHLSRAMNIDTIAYTNLPAFIEEFNNQGHFCSGNFEECLTKLKEKCTNLTK